MMSPASAPEYGQCSRAECEALSSDAEQVHGPGPRQPRRWRRHLVALGVASAALAGAACVSAGVASRRAGTPLTALRGGSPEQLYIVEARRWTTADSSSIALCVTDLWQAMGRVGQAGLAIDSAISNCQQPLNTTDTRAACSASVTSVVVQFSLLTALLSSSVSNCGLEINEGAACSARVAGLVGNIAAAASAGSSLNSSCAPLQAPQASRELQPEEGDNSTLHFVDDSSLRASLEAEAPDPQAFGRRLSLGGEGSAGASAGSRDLAGAGSHDGAATATSAPSPLQQMVDKLQANREAWSAQRQAALGRQRDIASCFFELVQATGFLSRAALGIESAAKMCDPAALREEDGPRKCATSVLAVIASFGLATQFLSASVDSCPVDSDQNAQCSTAVSGFVAALAACAAFGSDLVACQGVYPEGAVPFFALPVEDE